MTLEVVRERVGGIWRTVVRPEQAGGGSQPVVISDTEPAETFPGMLWIQTSVEPPTIYERSDADDAWAQVYPTVAAGLGDVLSTSGDAGGGAITNLQSLTGTGGDIDSGGGTLKSSGGDVDTGGGAIDTGGGSIDAGGARVKGVDDPTAGTDAVPRDWATVHPGGFDLAFATPGAFLIVNGDLSGANQQLPAAHVANGSSVDTLRDALIAAGFMAAS